jgi:hypothetical protein
MGKSIFELATKVTASGRHVLSKLEKDQLKAARAGAKSTAAWSAGLKKVGVAVGVAVGAVYTLKKVLDFGVEGESIRNIGLAFRAMNEDAGATLKTLEKGFRGTLDVTSLQQIAVPLQGLGADLKTTGKLADLAFRAYASKGGDAVDVAKAFTMAIASGRTQTLAQYGIVLSIADAQETYAKGLGVSVRALTELQKKQALTNAIIEEGGRVLGKVPLDKMSFQAHTLSKHLGDLWSDFNEFGGQAVGSAIVAGRGFVGVLKEIGAMGANASTQNHIHAQSIRVVNEALAIGIERSTKIAEMAENDARIAEIAAAQERERTKILDDQGKVLGERLQSMAAYSEASEDLATLQGAESAGYETLNVAQQKRIKLLQIQIKDYRELARVAVPFHVMVSSLLEKEEKSADDLAAEYVELYKIISTDPSEQTVATMQEQLEKLEKLKSVIPEVTAKYSDQAKVMEWAAGATQNWIKETQTWLRIKSAQIAAEEKATNKATEAAGQLAVVNALATDPTPAQKITKLYNDMARTGKAEGSLTVLRFHLLELYKAMGAKGAGEKAEAEALRLRKAALAAHRAIGRGRSSSHARMVSDITEQEATLRVAIATSQDETYRKLLEIGLAEMKLEEQVTAKTIGEVEARTRAKELNLRRQAVIDDVAKKRKMEELAEQEQADKRRMEQVGLFFEGIEAQERAKDEAHAKQLERWRQEDDATKERIQMMQANFAAMGEMGSEFGNQMSAAMAPASDAIDAFTAASRTSGEASSKSLASGLAASGVAVGAFIKDNRKRALVRGLFEQAAGWASLGAGDIKGFGLHMLSSALFFKVAGGGGGGGRKSASSVPTGQLAGVGRGAAAAVGSGGGGGGGVTINNYMQGFAVGTVKDLGHWAAAGLNSVAGEVDLDPRVVGQLSQGV